MLPWSQMAAEGLPDQRVVRAKDMQARRHLARDGVPVLEDRDLRSVERYEDMPLFDVGGRCADKSDGGGHVGHGPIITGKLLPSSHQRCVWIQSRWCSFPVSSAARSSPWPSSSSIAAMLMRTR